MKRVLVLLLSGVVMMMATVTVAQADVKLGQKIFKKKFRKKCRFSGVKFARHHTQGEWEELWDEDKFKAETQKICPRLKLETIKEEWWEHVYEFSYEYASDGSVPKC